MLNIEKAKQALEEVARRDGVPLETVVRSIEIGIGQVMEGGQAQRRPKSTEIMGADTMCRKSPYAIRIGCIFRAINRI